MPPEQGPPTGPGPTAPTAPAGESGRAGQAARVSFLLAVVVSAVVLFAPSDGGASPFPGSDKVVHLLLFAGLAATTRWRFSGAIAGLAAVAAYAPLSELVQGLLLRSRSGDPVDVVADLCGVALGWTAARRIRR